LKSSAVERQLHVFASVNFFSRGNAHSMPTSSLDRRRSIDAGVARRIGIELRECRVEQANCATNRASLDVVIRGRELDQPLEKRLFVARRLQPDFFPRFVGVPEMMGVEEIDARL
jgi:hypothetical protein